MNSLKYKIQPSFFLSNIIFIQSTLDSQYSPPHVWVHPIYPLKQKLVHSHKLVPSLTHLPHMRVWHAFWLPPWQEDFRYKKSVPYSNHQLLYYWWIVMRENIYIDSSVIVVKEKNWQTLFSKRLFVRKT